MTLSIVQLFVKVVALFKFQVRNPLEKSGFFLTEEAWDKEVRPIEEAASILGDIVHCPAVCQSGYTY